MSGEEVAFASSILSNFAMLNLDNLKNKRKCPADKSEIDLINNGNFFDYSNTFNSCLMFSRKAKNNKNRHKNKKVKQNHWTTKIILQMQDKNGKLVPV